MTQLQLYLSVGFVLFLIIMGALGYIASRQTKSMADFALGGESLGPVVLGLAFTATALSAATFLGYPGWSYEWGLSNMWLFLALLGGGPLGLIVVAKRARKLNVSQRSLSLPDWLGDYYGSDFLRVGSAIIMLFNIYYIAAQFAAGATIFEYMLGTSYKTGLIIIAVIVVVYVFAGGTLADIYTDAAQAVMMFIAGAIVFVSGIFIIGDGSITQTFTTIADNLASQDENLVKPINPESSYYYSIPAIIGIFIVQFAFASSPQLFNKVLAIRDERDLGKMILVYFVTLFLSLLILFGGLYSRVHLLDGVAASDLALIEYIDSVFPVLITALFGIVILAASMSTTDGIFVVISTIFANDIFYKVLVRRKIIKVDEARANRISLMIGRISVVVIGIVALLLVINPPQYMGDVMWIGISGVAAGTLGPILYVIFGKKKPSPRAAELSMVVGLVTYLVIYFTKIIPSTMAAGGWATVVGVIVMWIAANIFKPQEETTTD